MRSPSPPVPLPQVRHILDDPQLQKVFASPGPWSWGNRINDHLRAEGLKRAFATLQGDVLDFGCGAKPYESCVRHPGLRRWTGVDLPRRTSGPARFANRSDSYFDGYRLPFREASFDHVLSTQVLEHVPDLDFALSEITKVLKPGGRLVATVPMAGFLHEEPHDYRRFTPYGMAQLARTHGFELIDTVALGGPFVTLTTLAACQSNSLMRVPMLGALAHRLVSGGLTQLGYSLEVALYKGGYRKALLTLDYLFVLRKG